MLQNSAHTYIWPCISVRRVLNNRSKFVQCLLQKQPNSMIFSQSLVVHFRMDFHSFAPYTVCSHRHQWNFSKNSFRIGSAWSIGSNFHKWKPLYTYTILFKKIGVKNVLTKRVEEYNDCMSVQVISCRTPNLSNGNIALFTLWNDLS